MNKIPTMFDRNWDGPNKYLVHDKIREGCEWVAAGEGVATRKLDGTCCMVRAGKLYKRRELREGDTPPENFELLGTDDDTGKSVGWVPVGEDPTDKWHREAFSQCAFPDGTYELLGPKIQGNPEGADCHTLTLHSTACVYPDVPRTFDGIRAWLTENHYIEGLVFHHSDGRMAKIKLKDFGIKRVLHAAKAAQ